MPDRFRDLEEEEKWAGKTLNERIHEEWFPDPEEVIEDQNAISRMSMAEQFEYWLIKDENFG